MQSKLYFVFKSELHSDAVKHTETLDRVMLTSLQHLDDWFITMVMVSSSNWGGLALRAIHISYDFQLISSFESL